MFLDVSDATSDVNLATVGTKIKMAVSLTVVACVTLVGFLLVEIPAAAALAKIIASTGFLLVAVWCGALQSAYGRTLLAGLALSFLGDAFLIGDSQQAFLAGLFAFLLAHVAYISAFLVSGVSARWIVFAALPITAIALGVSSWLVPHTPADMLWPVRLYTAVISIMVIAAIGTRGKNASLLILSGALLFFLSDLSVASLRLLHVEFPTYVWGLPLYYAGQLCLALSVSQSRSH